VCLDCKINCVYYKDLKELNSYTLWYGREHFLSCTVAFGSRGTVVVEALYYKPEGRGFDTQ
jgi:hypothetical protein